MASRNITIQGNAQQTVIVTGDGNRVEMPHRDFVFVLLDEAFRRKQQAGVPADFYNGTRPNWANIAREHDAPRRLFSALMEFVQGEPGQRVGVITGLSGEGKTTLLMRLAWEAAAQGMPVLWRHSGHVFQPYERPFEQAGPVLICMDELPYVDNLLSLYSDLSISALPFVLLGTARSHEWANSPLRSELKSLTTVEEFPLSRLEGDEVQAILARLEAGNALGSLADLSPQQRLDYFLNRLQADGQLLPALITARAGRSFEAILESVFDRLQRRYSREDAALLLRGYAGIALVHRFGFWMTRRLLAVFLHQDEADLKHLLITPLKGELTEITETEPQRLYTRHPWIAERALQLLAGRRLPEERYLYDDLFAALGKILAANPFAQEGKLTTLLPLAFKYQGRIEEARRLFERASQADPKHAPTLQAWALLEKEQGRIEEARRLFERATQANPNDAVSWQAWALLEAQNGRPDQAENILRRGLEQVGERRGRALLLSTLGGVLARRKDYPQAEDCFHEALALDEKNALTHYHFAVDCLLPQGRKEEACQHLCRALALKPRKARDRQRIEAALRRHCP